MNQLRCLCNNNNEDWPAAIKKVQLSHNSSVNATTGFSPAKLILGQEFNLPDDLFAEERLGNTKPIDWLAKEAVHEELTIIDGEQERQVEEAEQAIPRDTVRYKLNDTTRNKLGGKISQRYSETHVITGVKENKYTYELKPLDPQSRGRVKDRHFKLLETIERKAGLLLMRTSWHRSQMDLPRKKWTQEGKMTIKKKGLKMKWIKKEDPPG